MKKLTLLIIPFISFLSKAQPYTDYIGAGHNVGIQVRTSDNATKEYSHIQASGDKTIDGTGLDGKKAEAVRFLQQAAFGYSEKDISDVVNLGIEGWIDKQLTLPSINYVDQAKFFTDYLANYYLSKGLDSSEVNFFTNWVHWRYGFWQNAIYGKDQLRQRMTFALSQLLVISDNSFDDGEGLASYYNTLSKNAFGNFRDLLRDVTLHTMMGNYLSHLNNPKTDEEKNIHPDQNYAREIMQLFTIGLFKLDNYGNVLKDNLGNPIPTYNNKDIEELAKVFTGLSVGGVKPGMGDLYFGRSLYGAEHTIPMAMFDEWHEQGPKKFLNHEIPAGLKGMQDIEMALDILFNHPNTPPFIAKHLIQRLVTSNPSPAYINRVALKFINDGNGVRGNLAAVLKAVLTDEEARSCASVLDPTFGKFSEPILRLATIMKGIGLKNQSPYLLNHSYSYGMRLGQHPLSAPSVFNFFKPDFQPLGPLSNQNLVSPELQILNSLTVVDYPNIIQGMVYWDNVNESWEDGPFNSDLELIKLVNDALDDETLINKLDLQFTGGLMTEHTRNVIKEAIKPIPVTLDGITRKIKIALYLTFLSPDFMVNK